MPRPYSPTTTGSGAPVQYVVGIDVGSETCFVSILRPDKTTVRSPFAIANAAPGFARLAAVLAQLDCAPAQIRVGLEATGRYWENLYQFLLALGYDMVLVHPGQTHHFAQQRGLRAKTDKLVPRPGRTGRTADRADRGDRWPQRVARSLSLPTPGHGQSRS